MRKFIIEATKGDTETIIQTFESLEEAMQFGEEYIVNMPRSQGLLTCAAIDMDAEGRRTSYAERIYHIWR